MTSVNINFKGFNFYDIYRKNNKIIKDYNTEYIYIYLLNNKKGDMWEKQT